MGGMQEECIRERGGGLSEGRVFFVSPALPELPLLIYNTYQSQVKPLCLIEPLSTKSPIGPDNRRSGP